MDLSDLGLSTGQLKLFLDNMVYDQGRKCRKLELTFKMYEKLHGNEQGECKLGIISKLKRLGILSGYTFEDEKVNKNSKIGVAYFQYDKKKIAFLQKVLGRTYVSPLILDDVYNLTIENDMPLMHIVAMINVPPEDLFLDTRLWLLGLYENKNPLLFNAMKYIIESSKVISYQTGKNLLTFLEHNPDFFTKLGVSKTQNNEFLEKLKLRIPHETIYRIDDIEFCVDKRYVKIGNERIDQFRGLDKRFRVEGYRIITYLRYLYIRVKHEIYNITPNDFKRYGIEFLNDFDVTTSKETIEHRWTDREIGKINNFLRRCGSKFKL